MCLTELLGRTAKLTGVAPGDLLGLFAAGQEAHAAARAEGPFDSRGV